MSRSAVLVVNPSAGGGRAKALIPGVVARLRAHGIAAEAVAGNSAAESRALAQAAVASGTDMVIACGGDGTVHTVLQEVVGTSSAFGILPLGTGNDNARALGIPRKGPEAAIDAMASAAVRSVDVGVARGADGEERFFLGVLSAGFDSAVNERANRMTRPQGTARYLVAIVGELGAFEASDYVVTVDGRTMQGRAMLVAVGNGISYGGGMKVCPRAELDDGVLEVTWVREVPRRTFLTVFPRVFRGTHIAHPSVQVERGRQIRLVADGPIAYADGERLGPLPLDVSVRPGALRVLAP